MTPINKTNIEFAEAVLSLAKPVNDISFEDQTNIIEAKKIEDEHEQKEEKKSELPEVKAPSNDTPGIASRDIVDSISSVSSSHIVIANETNEDNHVSEVLTNTNIKLEES